MTKRKQHRRTKNLPEPTWDALQSGNSRTWNRWRKQHPEQHVDLRGLHGPEPAPGAWLRFFDLRGADLRGVQFVGADLGHADLRGARLDGANLRDAQLVGADCREVNFGAADLGQANFRRANLARSRCNVTCSFHRARLDEADLSGANLQYADFELADLTRADLTGADLRHASFERADLSEAILDDAVLRMASFRRAVLYRTSFKGADLRTASAIDAFVRNVAIDENTRQEGLLGSMRLWFTDKGKVGGEVSRVDDLRSASLLALLSERGTITSLIDAGSATVVLLLGRFSPRRKAVLDRLAEVLRTKGKLPVLFDFPGPEDRELSDTVRVLATLAEFMVVDLSDPRSVPLELQATVPGLMIPVVPIVQSRKRVFAMLQDLQRRYFWVLPPVSYSDKEDLAAHLGPAILKRVRKVQQQIRRRREEIVENPVSVRDFGPAEGVDKKPKWIT
jgi:uncharacterized protein YjbI with pentapeptide repeats